MILIEKGRGFKTFKKFDYLLFLLVLAITTLGIIVLRSVTIPIAKGDRIFTIQITGWIIGVILAIIISSIDYKDFKEFSIIFYSVSVVLLLLVLIIGTGDKMGSKSWFKLFGVFTFQPSELAKITTILMISVFFEKIYDQHPDKYINIFKIIIFSLIPIALVLKQPDFGTAAVFIFCIVCMVFICGIPYKYIFTSVVSLIGIGLYLWFYGLAGYQKDRILVFFDPTLDQKNAGYNVMKSKIAIGSGQMFGKGLFQGIQTQNKGVPVNESDFIFSAIGEELGFIGSVIMVCLAFFIIIRCIYIAKNARDRYGSFIVIGLTSMLAFHNIENILMSMGMLPVTGIPMPFVSAGGTSMITNYIAIGFILSVSIRRDRTIFNN